MSIGQSSMTWLQTLEQLESYSDNFHEAWRLSWQAKEKLREALKQERQSIVTKEMGS